MTITKFMPEIKSLQEGLHRIVSRGRNLTTGLESPESLGRAAKVGQVPTEFIEEAQMVIPKKKNTDRFQKRPLSLPLDLHGMGRGLHTRSPPKGRTR